MISFRPVILLAFLASTAYAQFTINSLLNVVVCQPQLITWSGGTPPYFLSILPAGQPSAAPLVDLGTQTGTSVTWKANLAVGTGAFLNLRDSSGALAQSGTFTILTGSDTSCVGQSPSTSAGSSPTTTGGTTGGATGGTTPSGTGASTGSSTKASGSTTGSSTPKPTSAATVSQFASVGAAAMIGAALLALVA